ncbi:hypothetical protein L1267_11140 [Pseudoalteromonas sp. OFAV1]|uniref:hypothetical protein n=1 Tax=Pseudoalteromonas sp. OFAV1 TaxID=2908892 RepID=UPI001F39BB3C|nr:hypothetical protein [Pseudoalteromonas sp. OFAV1]MCF2900959.1 hypothetical protein [Pseudoalteromonas sp. OFAV1]
MYDSEKLYILLKRNYTLFSEARGVLDVLHLVIGKFTGDISVIQKNLPNLTLNSIRDIEKLAPDFISLGLSEKGEGHLVISKVLKRHFSSLAFEKQMAKNTAIDKKGLVSSKKDKPELSIKKVDFNILSNGYCGFLPTKMYERTGEVFAIQNDFIATLKNDYPSYNIESELSDIYEYLRVHPYNRKDAIYMRNFIEKWFSGELIRFSRKKQKANHSVTKDDFYEDLRNNGI